MKVTIPKNTVDLHNDLAFELNHDLDGHIKVKVIFV